MGVTSENESQFMTARRLESTSSGFTRFAERGFGARDLFDEKWYLQRNPELANARIDALTHYLQLGGFEGKDPNPLFDSDWYLTQYPDVARTALNPLVHYVRWGAFEGRDPHPLFDTDWYLAQNPDLPDGLNPLIHYIKQGAIEWRCPSKLFEMGAAVPTVRHTDTATLICDRKRRPDFPKVSIVVPVFNKARFISECLGSILAQTFTDIEIICVNDGSNDGSVALLQSYYQKDERITVVHNAHSYGAGIARNIGINIAQGEYLQFTDADDVLPPTAIEMLYCVAKNDNVEAVRGNLAVFSDSSSDAQFQSSGATGRLTKVDWTTTEQVYLPWYHVTYLISRELVVKNELSYPDLIDGEDPVFIAKVLVNAKTISTIPEITYLCRIAGGAGRQSLRHVVDFIRHAAMVRDVFLEFHAESWTAGYRPYLLGGFNEFFLRNTPRTRLEEAVIALALKQSGILADFGQDGLPAQYLGAQQFGSDYC
jgi:glycosyltransferase involved in cell wall biosynthesis